MQQNLKNFKTILTGKLMQQVNKLTHHWKAPSLTDKIGRENKQIRYFHPTERNHPELSFQMVRTSLPGKLGEVLQGSFLGSLFCNFVAYK
jgi:hypothetical protein